MTDRPQKRNRLVWICSGLGLACGGLIGYGVTHRNQGMISNGLRSLGTGLGLFVAFGLVFEGVIGLSGSPFLKFESLKALVN